MALVLLVVLAGISGDPEPDTTEAAASGDAAAAKSVPAEDTGGGVEPVGEVEVTEGDSCNAETGEPGPGEGTFERDTDGGLSCVAQDEPEPEPVVEEEPEIVVVEPERFRKRDYADLTNREFAKVVRRPDEHLGEQVLVFGEVFQFDNLTGPEQMLVYVDGDRDTEGEEFGIVNYDHNMLLVAEKARLLDDVVEGDHIAAYITIAGTFDYETVMTAETTVPMATVERVKVLPEVD